jgi:hypothetical protein
MSDHRLRQHRNDFLRRRERSRERGRSSVPIPELCPLCDLRRGVVPAGVGDERGETLLLACVSCANLFRTGPGEAMRRMRRAGLFSGGVS